jgi:hypothetical protein
LFKLMVHSGRAPVTAHLRRVLDVTRDARTEPAALESVRTGPSGSIINAP